MLQLHKESIAEKERLIEKIDAEIDKAVQAYQVEVEMLQSIDGVGKDSAVSMISEFGVDMGRFPDENHLSSWAGMSPGNNESGGKKSSKDGTWE